MTTSCSHRACATLLPVCYKHISAFCNNHTRIKFATRTATSAV